METTNAQQHQPGTTPGKLSTGFVPPQNGPSHQNLKRLRDEALEAEPVQPGDEGRLSKRSKSEDAPQRKLSGKTHQQATGLPLWTLYLLNRKRKREPRQRSCPPNLKSDIRAEAGSAASQSEDVPEAGFITPSGNEGVSTECSDEIAPVISHVPLPQVALTQPAELEKSAPQVEEERVRAKLIRRNTSCLWHSGKLCLYHKQQLEDPQPVYRPVSEPPNFNYDKFERDFIPSEDRVRLLYPDDVGKRCDHRDLVTECELLKTFSSWTKRAAFDRRDSEDAGFLSALADDIEIDLREVRKELERSNSSNADSLALWEYENLDNDMKTSFIEAEYRMKADIFKGCVAAREKYSHVCKRTLAEWEALFMTDGLTGALKTVGELPDLFNRWATWWEMDKTATIFAGCEEAKAKYHWVVKAEEEKRQAQAENQKVEAQTKIEEEKEKEKHLAENRETLEKWEDDTFFGRGVKAWIELRCYNSGSLFDSCDEAREKYGYLCSPTLEQWEKAYLDEDGGTVWAREQLLKHRDVFHGCPDAAIKYQHLRPSGLDWWEDRCLVKEGDKLTLRRHYRELDSSFLFLDCVEAKQKYGKAFETGALHKGIDIATSHVITDTDRIRWIALK